MDIVTLFQCHHSKTNTGCFTTDVNKSCAEEIENPNQLCFGYYLPNVFYFAEGGWGHHMPKLGNHPIIPDAVSLNIRFEGFDNTVVINGEYSFNDIIKVLEITGYIDHKCTYIKVLPVGCDHNGYLIPVSDMIMNICLCDFEKSIEQYNSERITLKQGDFIYHFIYEIF